MASKMSLQAYGTNILSGCFFGFALAFAGVASPAVIVSQLNLTSFHMLKVFISAAASSAVVIRVAQSKGYASPTPDAPASLGLLGRYDGNIIGGSLLGLGMAQAGACPGTLLPQLATGTPLAPIVLLSAMFGGGQLANLLRAILPLPGFYSEKAKEQVEVKNQTLYEQLNISPRTGLFLFELLCLSILGGATWWEAEEGILKNASTWKTFYPVVGGLAIGLAQGASLLLTRRPLGASEAYEISAIAFRKLIKSSLKPLGSIVFHHHGSDSLEKSSGNDAHSELSKSTEQGKGELAEKTTKGEELKVAQKPIKAGQQNAQQSEQYEETPLPKDWQARLAFALGTWYGARVLTYLLPSNTFVPKLGTVATGNLIIGGTLLILGARIAGGCTSGHGISGMSMGAKSSFVTVAAMFAGGIFGVRVLGPGWGFGWVS